MFPPRLAFLALCVCAVSLSAESPIGWRQDGTGRVSKATPPVKWSATENVRWKVALPGQSYAAPLVVGPRLYVLADPAELLCLDAQTGKTLWQRSTTWTDVFGEKKAGEIEQRHVELQKTRDEASRERNKLRKEMPDAKEALEKLDEKVRAAEKAQSEWQNQWPRTEGRGGAGRTAATPVWDGQRVLAVFGTGLVAAFSPEGKRLWSRFLEAPTIGFGHSSSPLVAGGRFIVHIKDVIALDPATGKEVWRVPAGASHSSLVAAKLDGEDVVLVPTGLVIRVSDGKTLLTKGRFQPSESTPIVDGSTLYVSRNGGFEAFSLSRDKDTVAASSAWKASGAKERRTPSSVLHDGLLYGVNTQGMLDVIEARTGETVYKQRLPLTQVYSSVAVAGDHVFVFDTRGKAVVFKTGGKYELVATNQLEGTGACPVFAGRRLYVRGQKHLYCLEESEK